MNVENVKRLFRIYFKETSKILKDDTPGGECARIVQDAFIFGYSLGEKRMVVLDGEVQDQVSTNR